MRQLIASLLVACVALCSQVMAEEPSEGVPLTWEQHFALGATQFDLGQYGEALSHYEKATIESDQQEVLAYNRGRCHLELGEMEAAEKHFMEALGSEDFSLDMQAQFQLATLYYDQSFSTSGNSAKMEMDIEKLKQSSFAFQEVQNIARRHEKHLEPEHQKLLNKATRNVRSIAAKYKNHLDQESAQRGVKTPIIQGNVKVNGRAVPGAKVYIKSKWEDSIMGHVNADDGGGFKFEDLTPGKYQLASALFDTKDAKALKWGEPLKVPTREKDLSEQTIKGAITLAAPYQTSVPSLQAPWDDHLRASGAESITSSTDWGELNDGFPASALPTDTDIHMAYVAFDAPLMVLAMAVPSQEQQEQQEQTAQVEQSTEPSAPPTFKVSLLGFYDNKDAALPDHIRIMGMKEGLEAPIPLYESVVQTSDAGLYRFDTEEFAHQDCRSLMIELQRSKGKHLSLHEVEVSENLHQEQDEQDQDQQDENQEQQDQEQEENEDQQDQEPEEQEQQQESRSTRAILQQIKDKNEEAKEKNKASGMIISTDKDY